MVARVRSSRAIIDPNCFKKDKQEEPRSAFWKRLSLWTIVPITLGTLINVFLIFRKEERLPFVSYEHLRIRNKKFPWDDGEKTFFHNPRVNALPGGYEDEMK